MLRELQERFDSLLETRIGKEGLARLRGDNAKREASNRAPLCKQLAEAERVHAANGPGRQARVERAAAELNAVRDTFTAKEAQLREVAAAATAESWEEERRIDALKAQLREHPAIDAAIAALGKDHQDTRNSVALTPMVTAGSDRAFVLSNAPASVDRCLAIRAGMARLELAKFEPLDPSAVEQLIASVWASLPDVVQDRPLASRRHRGHDVTFYSRAISERQVAVRQVEDGVIIDHKTVSTTAEATQWAAERLERMRQESERIFDDRRLSEKNAARERAQDARPIVAGPRTLQ